MFGLVGDIGGTNARFALWRDATLLHIGVLRVAEHATPEAAVRAYLAQAGVGLDEVADVCLACAGPVDGDLFRFTNNAWTLGRRAFCRELGLQRLLLVNDFSAMALAIPALSEDELLPILAGKAEAGRPRLVIGPGTGLGVSGLLPLRGGRWMSLPGEGGHVDLPVAEPEEAAIWEYLYRKEGRIDAERVLSGSGLLRLYRACCALRGQVSELQTPGQVTEAALAGDPLACEVLERFCVWLGRVAGNAVLNLGAQGGVYIAGGVVPRFAEFFRTSGFRRGFLDKGAMSEYCGRIPVFLVTATHPGLLGAGLSLQQAREAG